MGKHRKWKGAREERERERGGRRKREEGRGGRGGRGDRGGVKKLSQRKGKRKLKSQSLRS